MAHGRAVDSCVTRADLWPYQIGEGLLSRPSGVNHVAGYGGGHFQRATAT